MFPFEWKTPFGYIEAWLSETVGISVVNTVMVLVLVLIFASSSFFNTIADDDLTQKLSIFNKDVRTSNGRGRDHRELMRRFGGIIQLYSDAKG